MKLRSEHLLPLIAVGICGLAQIAAGQQTDSVKQRVAGLCHTGDASGVVTLHAAHSNSSVLNLCDGHSLGGGPSGVNGGEPLALASGDFDQDGMPDLVSAFRSGNGGVISVYRGNVAALWSYGAAVGTASPSALFPKARTFAVPETPDFVVTGDFDADGHWDIVTAQRGSSNLYFLSGNGHGGFAAAKRLPVAGSITAMISGEINRPDGLPDIILAVTTPAGARALVLESPNGAVNAQPEVFKLPQPATALALGHFSGNGMFDLAIGSGNQLLLIEGRDRKLSLDAKAQAQVPPATVSSQLLSYSITSLVTGDFTGTGPAVAALSSNGRVHVLEHNSSRSLLGEGVISDPSYIPTFQAAKPGKDGKPVVAAGHLSASMRSRLTAQRARAGARNSVWTERSAVELPSGFAQPIPQLVAARVSGSLQEDILAVDSGNRQLHILSTAGTPHPRSPVAQNPALASASAAPMHLLSSINAESAPAAVLPMRLSKHGLAGLVTLHSGMGSPSLTPQDTSPANVFVVTNTSDITSSADRDAPPAGSLRAAMEQAGAAFSENGGGSYQIVFNIPTSDPGYNPADGSFLIQPLSENVLNSDDNFALPPINATVVIDGYTQPGASPNTSTTEDNAKILIRIDGAKASTPGGSGLVPFDDTGSVFRGLNLTGWTNPAIEGNTASGGMGIEANGVGDFIEGNFFGTDPTGSLSTDPNTSTSYGNRLGVFVDNGPEDNSGGNIVGGTTPQARNILSNNEVGGILFLSIGFEGQAQGNFIGVDHTGAIPLPNTEDGVGSNGPTIVIGGVAPNSGNVISGNGTDVDFNDLTDGGAAANSSAWGNLIGTDSTGTKIVDPAGNGVSITAGANNENIGGTTPAARNVISGNIHGVYVFDNANGNIIQGNYIGTDITGTIALGNEQQGYLSGGDSSSIPAISEVVGGAVAGAGNLISGNGADGVLISGTANIGGDPDNAFGGSTVQGNYIGTDATGTAALGNGATGVTVNANATNNTIGGTAPGSGNLIANNASHGVFIDPGTTGGQGTNNQTIGNTILSNGGAGVRINTGTGERVSVNSIYQNAALGIDIGPTGQNANSSCNSSNNGANLLLNSPVMTGGSGSFFITATATDANGNTSEFSNAVPANNSGDLLSLTGTYNGVANSTYTIEFFSSPSADPSGFGQGKTFLGSTTVTTDGSCNASLGGMPIDTTGADVSVSLTTSAFQLSIGPDFGAQVYAATVSNNGPATATNVTMTNVLPASLEVSSAYCNVGSCQTPITTTLGTCSVSGNTVTCALGTMAPGASATVNIPVQALAPGSISDTATVSATQTDPNPANNSSTLTKASTYPEPFIDTGTNGTVPNIVPGAVVAGSPDTLLTIYGFGFLSSSTVTFNGTPITISGFVDNQTCADSDNQYCAALQIVVPASQLATASTPTIEVTNPDPGPNGGSNTPSDVTFNIVSSCTFTTDGQFAFINVDQSGTDLIPVTVNVTPSAPSCSWTASSSVPWIVLLDTHQGFGEGETDVADTGTATGSGTAEFAVAANTGADARTGSITVAGLAYSFTQPGGATCDESLTPTTQAFPVAGGPGSFAVTTGCFAPSVVSFAPWITLATNGSTNFTVSQNVGAPRTGTIAAGGAVFTVTQAAQSCYYVLDTASALFPASGSTGTINVTASAPTCTWTATPSSSQIVVNSGATGTGNGIITYTVAPNTGAPDSPTITVGNTTAYTIFTANQASPLACTFTITPATNQVSSQGISTYFQVTASQSFCQWTAVSSDPANLTINGTNGTTVYYRLSQNDTGAPRTLTITAGCQIFTINQSAVSAANPVPAITAISPTTVAAASPNFTLTVTGSNFAPGATISLSGVGIPTTYVSATQVTAVVTTSVIALDGTYNVAVTNPSPGGGTSNTLPLIVTPATSNPVPVITESFPGSSPLNGPDITVTVQGLNYVSGSVLSFNGTPIATTFVSGTVLTGVVPANDLTVNGDFPIVVTNPVPGGGTSNATDLFVGNGTGTPTITLLQPASIAAGSAAFTLNVIGANYVSGSVINFNGTAATTTQQGATELSAAIPASAITAQGTVPVTVTNPSAGGTSPAANLTITAPGTNPPVVTVLQPASVIAGSAAFSLVVTGTNFVSGSAVSINGLAVTTTFVSATRLTAAVPASAVTTAGTVPVTVTNPAGGVTSAPVNFSITAAAAAPTITALQPSSVTAGAAAFSLTVTGTNYVNGATVSFNGAAMTTTFVSATQLTATIPASAVATAGTVPVTVTNPSGGGASAPSTFTITAAAAPPTIATLQPASVTAGSAAFSLTVSGMNYVSGATVNFNGATVTTTFVSAAQLTAAIPALAVATAGTVPVTVTNPSGGGTSAAVNFAITAVVSNPVPTLTSIQPASVTSGSGALTLTAAGTNFIGTSVVNVNGSPRTTTLVNATQLTAALTATDVASAGSDAITVTNPAPGGGTTAALTLIVAASNAPAVTFDKTSLSFAGQQQTTTSAAQTVNLTNSGSAPLNIASITIGGSTPSDFAQTNTCPTVLDIGASCPISVTFTPASTGSYSATVAVADNATGSPQTVALSGTGIPPPNFTVTGPAGAQTVQAGGTALFTITVAATNGNFPGSVTLSASGLPTGATANFSPATLTPGSASATSQLSIQTAGPTASAAIFDFTWPRTLLMIPGIMALTAIGRRRKRLFPLLVLLLASLAAATAIGGCGGGFGMTGSTYNITVTGTSGSDQQTTSIQLTVR
jgi:hypothetical protein